ncbi:MAG: 3-isopropylmalate dehydrogenase [Acetobacteraceae bacterium]
MKQTQIVILPGDGIGPEVVTEGRAVLEALARRYGLPLRLSEAAIGGAAYERYGDPLPKPTLEAVRAADAVLFGAEGGFQYETLPRGKRPGDGLLRLRKELQLYANFRPVLVFPELAGTSPLRPEVIADVDLVIVRELTGGVYFGTPRGLSNSAEEGRIGINTMRYSEAEIRRVGHKAFQAAMRRRRRLCSVDKANVLETMELWRTVMDELQADYPEVALSHLYVDTAAMALIREPRQFDVIVTGNLLGDVLSDEAAVLAGSIGMLPSASLGEGRFGLYEPVHGCAPDIAGKDLANPLATILSCALMLRMSFGREAEARRIEAAVRSVLGQGYRTPDITEPGCRTVGTREMGRAVVDAL